MLKKYIFIVFIIITVITILPLKTYASGEMDSVISAGKSFIAAADSEEVIDKHELQDASNKIYNTLFVIAVVLAVAVGIIIGIKFIIGSVEEQAKIKETLVPYVIGVFVIFSAFGIWKVVVNIGEKVSPTATYSDGGGST